MWFCRSLTVNISVTTAICLLLSSINKTAEAYSKVNRMLFNHLSNYHYLLTKKKLLKFSIFILLPYLGLLLCLIIFCRGCMCTSNFQTPVQTGLHPPAQLELLLHSKQISTLSPSSLNSINSLLESSFELLTPSPLPLYYCIICMNHMSSDLTI